MALAQTELPLDASASRVRLLDPANAAHRSAAADLILALFPKTPAGALGRQFLEKFYFSDLVADGLLDCLLYWDGDKAVSFCIVSTDPHGFIKRGIQRHFFKLVALVGVQLVLRPTRIFTLLSIVKQGSFRAGEANPGRKTGELLTFGTMKSHRATPDPETGKKISPLLLLSALKHLRARGCDYVQAVSYRHNDHINALVKRCGGEPQPLNYFYENTYFWHFDLVKLGY